MMEKILKYRIIKTEKQYIDYCKRLKFLLDNNGDEDDIELLTLLIEKWDEEQYQVPQCDPIQIIKALMDEHNLKATDLKEILSLSKGTVSKILNYQKGLSKETIRRLAEHFKLSQESFNRPYVLKNEINKQFKNEALMNTKKKLIQTV